MIFGKHEKYSHLRKKSEELYNSGGVWRVGLTGKGMRELSGMMSKLDGI